MHVHDVNERERRFIVRRVFLPARVTESFTVIGPDLRPVELVDEYLAWLTDCERSPNTVEAYAHDLRAFWTFLAERGLGWDQVGVMELETGRLLEKAHKNNNVRLIEVLERDEQSLTRILDGLEQIDADHADTGGGDQLDLRDLAAPDQTESA